MNTLPPYTIDNILHQSNSSINEEACYKTNNTISYPPTYDMALSNEIIDIPPPKYEIILNLCTSSRDVANVSRIITQQPLPFDFCYYCTTCTTCTTCTCCKNTYNLFCCKTGCYRKDSPDMRCCGLCYMCSDEPTDGCCIPTMTEYFKSGLWKTTDGYGSDSDNYCCTIICLPVKIPLCFPCLLATIFNSIINSCRGTNNNYLF